MLTIRPNPLIILIIFTLSAYLVSAGFVTVCSSGCDYSDLDSALAYTNNTANETYINEGNRTWTISPSSYFNISVPDGGPSAIRLNASNITLDCGNSTLNGSTQTGIGIYATSKNNETIMNCRLTKYNWAYAYNPVSTGRVIDSYSYYNSVGFVISGSSNIELSNLISLKSLDKGLYLSNIDSITVKNCSIINTTLGTGKEGIYLNGVSNAVITNNTIMGNYIGIAFIKPVPSCTPYNPYNNITNNNIISNQRPMELTSCDPTTVLRGNYWGRPNRPYFNCSIDFISSYNICGLFNDTSPYGQKEGWKMQSSFSGTDFANLSSNTGGNYSSIANVTLTKGTSQIRFNNTIDFDSAVDLDEYISFGSGFVSINTAGLKTAGNDFNRTANVTLQVPHCSGLVIKHVSSYYTSLGDILANGVDCATDGSCSDIRCSEGIVTFTANRFDGFGGNVGAVPEFSTMTTIMALAIVLAGFFAIRRKS